MKRNTMMVKFAVNFEKRGWSLLLWGTEANSKMGRLL